MVRQVWFSGLLLPVVAILILCFSFPAFAVEDVPGDSCSGVPTNAFRWAGAPENGGVVNGMFCNTNWAGVITFKSSGNVGIGTTSPGTLLSVGAGSIANDFGASIAATPDIAISKTSGIAQIGAEVNDGTANRRIGLFVDNTNGISGISTTYTLGAIPMVFRPNGSEAMRIETSGAVAMGITTPTARLHVGTRSVDGGTAPTTIGASAYYLGLGGQEFATNSYRLIGLGYKNSGGAQFPSFIGYQETNSAGATYGDLIFGTRSVGTDTAPSERMRIAASGNVGIGTASPAAALHVVGDIRYTGILADVSDRRAKKDIRPLPSGQLAKIMQLQPVSFVMKDDQKGRTEFGLIAQDTEPLYPELVQTDKDGSKSLGYVGLVAPLIKAVQEQQAEIEHLREALAVVFFIALVPGFLLWRNRAK